MTRFLQLLSCAVLLATINGAVASPTCAQKNSASDQCVSKCKAKFGWPGYTMGSNPWGSVAQPSSDDVTTALSKACKAKPTIAGGAAVDTQPAMAVPSPPTSESSPPALSTSSAQPSSFSSSSEAPKTSSSAERSTSTAPTSSAHLNKAVVKPSSTPPPSTTSEAPKTSPPPPPPPPPSTSKAAPSSPPTPPKTSSNPAPSTNSFQATGDSSGSASSSGGTSGSDIDQYLSGHNTIRAQHGAAPLTWSDNLASKAQQWANGCVFKHSGGSLGPFGENLAAGTGDSYDIAAGIKSWTDEVSQYNPSSPVASHFTQVVWKASTQVGCAEAQCDGIFAASFGKAKFFVCEYSPQGNVEGEFGTNVQV